jgi:hypothetical protein
VVLGDQVAALVTAMLLPLSAAGGAAVGALPASDHAVVAGYELRAEARDGRCVVSFVGRENRGELGLAPLPPCRFIRDFRGDPQHVVYKDIGEATVLIVVGTPVTLGAEAAPPGRGEGCGTESQGIIVRKQGVLVSARVNRGSLKCPSRGQDEKEFWLFAH